jgi:PAS domain S-box-containing protein
MSKTLISDFVGRCGVTLRPINRVLTLGAALSILAGAGTAYLHRAHNEKIVSEHFDASTARIMELLRRQMQMYEKGLRAMRGAVIASGDQLSLERFRQYSASRNIPTEFPGVRGFGFIKIVPEQQTASFVEANRSDGRPGFKIRELGEHAGARFVVQYLDSITDSNPATGLDIASDPNRRDAANAAVDSGETRLSAPITLVQTTKKQDLGLLCLLPIYRYGLPRDTPEQRRAAAIGWSFATLFISDVMDSSHLLSDEFAISISDRTATPAVTFFSTQDNADTGGALLRDAPFNIFGRDWQVETRALPQFFAQLNLVNPALTASTVLALGLLLTSLLSLHLAGLRRREIAWLERSRLAVMVEESSEAIAGYTLTGEVTDWNPAAEQLFGYTASEVRGRSIISCIVPEHLVKELDDAVRRVMETKSAVRLTTQRRSRDGKLLDMVVNLCPIRAEDGAVVGIATSARDITSFVQAQREVHSLNESLEQQVAARTAELKATINAIPSMIAYWDKDQRCGFANKAYLEWFGRDPDTMIGQTILSLLGESLYARNEPHIRAALAGQQQNIERALTKADGTTGHSWTNYIPHFDDHGEVLGFFVMGTDVTLLRQAELRVEASEARYRLLAENSSDMIFQLDRDLIRRYISPASRQILGYEATDLIGTRPVGQIHPEDAERVAQTYQLLLDGDLEHGSIVNRIRHLDGRWIWVEATLRALRDASTGDVGGIVGALRDITARKAIEAELEAAKQAAEDAARIKGEFLAAMSHELRTPLNSIIGFSRLILESPTPKDTGIENRVRLIHGASKTLLSIVNDVLDVSKLEADRLELDRRSFSIRSLVTSTLELLRGQADTKNLLLDAEIAADVPENLVGDDNRIRQILMNLVSNALKFTARGGVSVTVAQQGGDPGTARLRVGVRDTGIGIPESARQRIFHKFSQVDGTIARSYGGTGLGLSICKRLVELMGGAIDFDSKEGEGSEFWFMVELPIAAQGQVDADDGDESADAANGRAATILLAEDNPLNQQLAAAYIEQWGHSLDIVSNGADAIEAASRKDYDIVLMDVQMPVVDGVEATTRIRSLGGRHATVPIIAMTASVLLDQVESFRRAGMSDHIGKPFEPSELRRMIDRWVDAGVSGGAHCSVAHGEDSVRETVTVSLVPAMPHETVEDDILDEAVYAQLSGMIGDEKAAHIARQFADDLARRFNDLSNRTALRTDAHTIVSSAGALGFKDLSASSRQLEYACDGAGDLEGATANFLERRRRVGEFIVKRFGSRNAAGRAVVQMDGVEHE